MVDGQQLPKNIEAEEAVLGSLLINGAIVPDVARVIKPEHFFLQKNAWIYEAILDLNRQATPVDTVSVPDELQRRGRLEGVGGAAYLTGLITQTPNSTRAVHYAKIVREAAMDRWLIRAASGIAQDAFNPEIKAAEAVSKAQSVLANTETIGQDTFTLAELAGPFMDAVAERQENPDGFGLKTEIVPLDNTLGGGMAAGLYILAARPSMGKTAIALQIATNTAKRGDRVLFVTLEMEAERLMERIVLGEAGLGVWKYNQGDISDEDIYRINDITGQVYEWPMSICAPPGIKPGGIRTRIQAEQRIGDLDLVVVDYLNLVTPTQSRDTRTRELGDICRECLQISKDFSLPILLVHQLNRGVETRADKRPMMSDLRGSGEISEAADVIMMLYREGYYGDGPDEGGEMEILIRKNRIGGPADGRCRVYWNAPLMRCEPLARGQEAPPEVDF
jgi:replicative DNA helicase